MAQATDYFKATIQRYLEQRAQTDELFAPVYAKTGKNIEDCITYILNYVKQSRINGFSDEEIYSLALHYYDMDGIDVGKPISCNVVVNHTITLTEEEKAQARREALDSFRNETYNRMKQPVKKQQQAVASNQKSLFDL